MPTLKYLSYRNRNKRITFYRIYINKSRNYNNIHCLLYHEEYQKKKKIIFGKNYSQFKINAHTRKHGKEFNNQHTLMQKFKECLIHEKPT